jgi:hypothetical protein
MTKLIFLDVDGVLNVDDDARVGRSDVLRPKLLQLLGLLVRDTGAKIVLSSTWRHHPQLCKILTEALVEVGNISEHTVVSMTGDSQPGPVGRAEEIASWLDATIQSGTAIAAWVVLDDLPLGGVPYLANHFVRVDPHSGLTQSDVKLATKILNSRQVTCLGTGKVEEDVEILMEQYQAHKIQIEKESIHIKVKNMMKRKEDFMNDVSDGDLPWFDTGGGSMLRIPMAHHVEILDQNIKSLRKQLRELSSS